MGGRSDLPLPLWQVAWAAACAVAVSFAAVGILWHKPLLRTANRVPLRRIRLRTSATGEESDRFCGLLERSLAVSARSLGLFAFAVVFFAAARGNTNPYVNIAPVAIYVVLWVGIPVVSMAIGDVWQALNPLQTVAAAVDWLVMRIRGGEFSGGEEAADASPSRPDQADAPRSGAVVGNHWWAALVLVGFTWLELAYHDPDSPRAIALFLAALTLAIAVGSAVRGRDWVGRADGFAVLFSCLGAMAPLRRGSDGHLHLCWPLTGLASVSTLPGTEAVVLTVLGATAFDSLAGTSIWLDMVFDRRGWELTAYNTVGLLSAVGAVFVVYRAAIAVMAVTTGDRDRELADLFVPSLLPICAAYTVAHYFSLVVFEGQRLLAHTSDPFGRGWNLFGTASNQVNYTAVSPAAIAWVQTAAIVVGHVLGVIAAHDRAVERYPHDLALRSQYPMLAAMITFTVAGLLLLFSG